MTVNELYSYLNEKIPPSLSCEWDNDGLMCCPDKNKEVKKALVCLDVTSDAINEAILGGYDIIVSHHPLIFKSLKSLNESDFIPKKAMELIKANISVMSFHTRLDAVSGGVNDTLATLLGLKNVRNFGLSGEEIGRIGELDAECTLSGFARTVKETLGAQSVACADAGKKVKTVAVLGGAGGDFVSSAIAAGADTYVSGELGHHNMTDAPDMGINLIEASHFYTEDPVCEVLMKMLSELSIEADKFNSNRIFTV